MTERKALKLALEALKEITVNASDYDFGPAYEGAKQRRKKAITAIREALAQPEQEPVACIGTNGELMWLNKPMVIYSKPQPLYTTPPQRTWEKPWVGLTEAEIEKLAHYHGIDSLYEPGVKDFYEAIADKLKEKNT